MELPKPREAENFKIKTIKSERKISEKKPAFDLKESEKINILEKFKAVETQKIGETQKVVLTQKYEVIDLTDD